jgi:hypothetical protein
MDMKFEITRDKKMPSMHHGLQSRHIEYLHRFIINNSRRNSFETCCHGATKNNAVKSSLLLDLISMYILFRHVSIFTVGLVSGYIHELSGRPWTSASRKRWLKK